MKLELRQSDAFDDLMMFSFFISRLEISLKPRFANFTQVLSLFQCHTPGAVAERLQWVHWAFGNGCIASVLINICPFNGSS